MEGANGVDKTPLLSEEESRVARSNGHTNGHAVTFTNGNGVYHAVPTEEDGSDSKDETSQKGKESPPAPVPFSRLFHFADKLDFILMVVGSITACAVGATMPIFTLIFGSTVNVFASGPDAAKEAIARNAQHFAILAAVAFVLNFTTNTCFSVSAERQVRKMREQYLAAVLRQEIGWFDTNKTGEITTRIKGDTLVIRQGIGEKLGRFLQFLSTFIAGFTIGFMKGWKLALVMLSVVPLMAVSAGFLFRQIGTLTTLGQKLYAEAGAVAEQSISSIRTVAAFTGEVLEAARYRSKLDDAQKVGIQSGKTIARGLATLLFIIFASYGLGMWYGAKLIIQSREDNPGCQYQMPPTCSIFGGDILVVFWSVIFGAMSIGQCGPNLASVAEAKGAAAKLIETVLRKPAIDVASEEGRTLAHVKGKVEFNNIKFRYPARPDAQIFESFNLVIEPGQTVALVGGSGSGKSTVVSLLERFYDPEGGEVLLDGVPIKSLNLQWLRKQMGLVSQEPILLATTIAQNIGYGKPSATMEEIVEAAKAANAHNFIMTFPDAYMTQVGEMGVQLSGGQKQRVAIARAILRDPSILLLDEATSALDNESERVVQDALDRLMEAKRRTTIVIAHRLSTIRKADKIVVMSGGKVVESGRHEELMAIEGGTYRTLVGLQTLPGVQEGGKGEDGELLPIIPHHHSHHVGGHDDHAHHDEVPHVVTGKAESGQVKFNKGHQTRLWQLSRPEWKWVGVALCTAIVNGCTFPLYSLLLSSVVSVLLEVDSDYVKKQVDFWSIMFLVLATVVFVATFTQLYAFTVMGEKVTTRLRDMAFSNTIRQDVGFFDRDENGTGAICARLATEVTLIKNITGQNLGRSVQNLVTVVAAFTVAFVAGSWKMTVVLSGVLPVLCIASFIQMRELRQNTDKMQDSIAKAGTVATQAITGIRTVTAFGMHTQLMALYSKELDEPELLGIRNGCWRGMVLGFGQFIMLSSYGLLFWYGGNLWLYHGLSFKRMLRSLMAVTMSAQGLGENTSFLGDQAAAESAAARIFAVVDRRPDIDSSSGQGEKLPVVKGRIELRKVNFTYPSRPEAPIFRGFTLEIEAGTTVALVGSSGSGKSTVVSLVERFYDPAQGEVFLDGTNLKSLNLKWLRQQIGLVSQEPVLFATTIAGNVSYGKPGATLEEVIEACKAANAHDFIMSFPDGYQTEVGDRGVQLSGGQKQRISIARAIIKDPSILLLDEATSALDSESEVVVQQALDRLVAAKKRTTVVVAHRLSTIRKADKIVVVMGGRVVEQGTHEELMALPNSQYQLLSKMST